MIFTPEKVLASIPGGKTVIAGQSSGSVQMSIIPYFKPDIDEEGGAMLAPS